MGGRVPLGRCARGRLWPGGPRLPVHAVHALQPRVRTARPVLLNLVRGRGAKFRNLAHDFFKKTTKWRPLVVFTFGLLHGLGFATLLTQYGLPKDNFISSVDSIGCLGYSVGQRFY